MDLVVIRVLFIVVLTAASYFLEPFGMKPWAAAVAGAVAASAVIVFELRVRALSIKRLLGAVLGSILGIAGAALFGMVLGGSLPPGGTRALLQLFVLMLMSYIGLMVGASKGDLLNFTGGLADLFGERGAAGKRNHKILDTSAIIDGRIADVVETGFLDGTLVVPEFVLRELQSVADSSDNSRRQRGRRGLDILQKMQADPMLVVQIVEDDFPQLREVDLKLIELAKKMGAPIVTNDFNLSKVAQLHQVRVLNLNDLANSLKPLVLPGERMNIMVIKEGKEYNQGVGYLDDGTMVVVDHARRMIGRAVEITVTSVLQTASGKMIFGKLDEASGKPEQARSVTELST
jgi:uncharacterized protein YacL